MDDTQSRIREEIAHAAARFVVEEGLEYGPAKKQAVRQLGLGARAPLPDNEELEDSVREYIELFCADTQPAELHALRELALLWMERLQQFRPHLAGAVWHGTATRHSDVHLQLFCDDPKSAELTLIDHQVSYDVSEVRGFKGQAVPALTLGMRCEPLQTMVGLHLVIYDADDLRGALVSDRKGRPPRGDIHALRRLLSADAR